MKCYILGEDWGYDGGFIPLKVYLSEEKADSEKGKLNREHDWPSEIYAIYECEVIE